MNHSATVTLRMVDGEERTHGEWFRYEGPLVAHVAALQAAEDDA